jgi:hypothetical protein
MKGRSRPFPSNKALDWSVSWPRLEYIQENNNFYWVYSRIQEEQKRDSKEEEENYLLE